VLTFDPSGKHLHSSCVYLDCIYSASDLQFTSFSQALFITLLVWGAMAINHKISNGKKNRKRRCLLNLNKISMLLYERLLDAYKRINIHLIACRYSWCTENVYQKSLLQWDIDYRYHKSKDLRLNSLRAGNILLIKLFSFSDVYTAWMCFYNLLPN